jgi:hypothetical protein
MAARLIGTGEIERLEDQTGAPLRDWKLYADDERLQRLFDRMAKSREGRKVAGLCAGKDKGAEILFAENMDKLTFGEALDGLVVLNGRESDDRLVRTLAHELRHVEQRMAFDSRVLNRNGSVLPEALLLCQRVEEGDAFAFEALVSEQLRRAGDAGPFSDLMREHDAETAEFLERRLRGLAHEPAQAMKALVVEMQDRIGRLYDDDVIDGIEEKLPTGALFARRAKDNSLSFVFNDAGGVCGFMKLGGENYFPPEEAEGFVQTAFESMTPETRQRFEKTKRRYLERLVTV